MIQINLTGPNREWLLSVRNIIACAVLCMLLFGCGSGSGKSTTPTTTDDTTDDTGGTGSPASLGTYNALGLITDTSDQPIDFAVIGDDSSGVAGASTQSTSSGGAFYGEMGTEASGWVRVSADGYAETYTKSLGTVNSVNIFTTRLTPLGASTEFEPGTAKSLSHNNISIELTDSLFAAKTTVELTEIPPQDMDASYALMSTDIFRPFLRTFSITALDADGVPATFVTGQNLPVTITLPAAVSTPPPLAYFDGTSGQWQEVANICTLVDSTHVTCNLPHLSVWGAAGAAATGAGVAATADGEPTMPYPNATTRAQAKANIRYGMAISAQGQRAGDDDLVNTGETIMAQGAAQYVSMAQQYAANHQRDETGKFALIDAAVVSALVSGYDGTFDELMNEATTIAENIGTDLLAEPGCGRIREMLQSAAQIQTLGGSETLFDQLLDKVRDAINTCDPWLGKINVTFNLAGSLPGLSEFINQGGGAWTETHDVRLYADPSTAGNTDPPVYTLTGDDIVEIAMPETIYRETITNSDCPDGFTQFILFSTPQSASINLAVDGTYSPEGSGFAISSIKKAVLGGVDSIDLSWSSLLRTYIGDQCSLYESPAESGYKTGYESLIGDSGIQPTAPITLQEMLNNGRKYSSPITETVYGSKTVQLSIPEVTIPWAAVQSARVYWHFTHIKPQQ
ncbi:MAG: hypothetical protein KKB30_10320 [Proteobacteria bacterium]|nr:hypothetical protein [Pseudomonadota bacterium]MBU1717031.1 hypothetical protein [Pseudomonadota bacterium]